jgi:hypothetical protein
MKKISLFLVILCFAMMACKGNKKPETTTDPTTETSATEKPIMTIDEVDESWQTAPIKEVESADVLDMVEAFQKQWPTQSVAALLKDLELPEDEQQYLSFYEKDSNYLSFAEGSDDPDSEEMSAHVWQRSNGHQLLGISFFQASSDVKSFLAFFDYDPSTGMLTPETSLANLFTPSYPNVEVGYRLPLEGDELIVNEYYFNWWRALQHVYSWDGMKPCHPETEFDELSWLREQFDEDYMTYEMDDFSKYALIDIDEDGEPELWLSSEDEEYQAVLSLVEGEIKIIAGKDFKRQIVFYKGVVGDAGGCGTGCYYARYTKLKNSAPEYEFTDLMSYVFETDEMEDEYAKDGELLTEEEAEEILHSFGEPIEPEVKWCPLKTN